jgi:alkylated DNA repair dioxygenase AlkB
VIRYDPGAGIGWHRDRPVFEHVIGVSLGAPASRRHARSSPRPSAFRTRWAATMNLPLPV